MPEVCRIEDSEDDDTTAGPWDIAVQEEWDEDDEEDE